MKVAKRNIKFFKKFSTIENAKRLVKNYFNDFCEKSLNQGNWATSGPKLTCHYNSGSVSMIF